MRAAFYRGTRPGIAGLYNRLVRWWCRSPYSHCELIFSDGMAASASYMDGGVRFKAIEFSADRWDVIDLSGADESAALAWFIGQAGRPYDLLGNLGFLWRPIAGARRAWFCSEAVAAALGYRDPWRYDPATLASVLTRQPPMGGVTSGVKHAG
ncbi:hypothetical protein [Cupriavidus sp. a3]|uniref:hypothetical protein n=1 Tax=Cupriavidus sp. a3 TaxID=3242158 RepID=UPI003D9C2D50